MQGNFNVQDNEALSTPADFTGTASDPPTDSRLPTSGRRSVASTTQNRSVVNRQVIKAPSNFGNQYGHWNGFDVTSMRACATVCSSREASAPGTDDRQLRNRRRGSGGASIAERRRPAFRRPVDRPVAAARDSAAYCHQETPFLTNSKGWHPTTLPYESESRARGRAYRGQ